MPNKPPIFVNNLIPVNPRVYRYAAYTDGKSPYSHAWSKVRRYHISGEPLCVKCKEMGEIRAADVVDHIIPIRVDPDRLLDADNLQSLCHYHHQVKSAQDYKMYPEVYGNTPDEPL